ncbi:MAG: FAD-dependent oxidoreductase [Planctomycetes bacterium]|nr:FAD-dependent oxidoreductase [Planctomycetota bacterium]
MQDKYAHRLHAGDSRRVWHHNVVRIFDHIVLGHGRAGLALEAELSRRGQDVVVVDAGDATASSRVAAGLITPITGQRFTRLAEYAELFEHARTFYDRLGTRLQLRPALRLLRDEDERERFEERRSKYADVLAPPDTANALAARHGITNRHGAFLMTKAARLDIRGLQGDRRTEIAERFVAADVDPAEVVATGEHVTIPSLDLVARRLTFCDGARGRTNPWLNDRRFTPAKGEILTVRVRGPEIGFTLHADGLWLTPTSQPDEYLLGATFEPGCCDTLTTETARTRMTAALRSWVRCEPLVLDHVASLRPIFHARHPEYGTLANAPRVGFVNGLGARGSLLAPRVIVDYCNLLEASDSKERRELSRAPNTRCTTRVHDLLTREISAGDLVIDATLGNGHDTVALARLVGDDGFVHAFDIDEQAIAVSTRRLRDERLSNVRCVRASHADMALHVQAAWRGKVRAVVFNLGYLPGSAKERTTDPDSTIPAIRAALDLLAPRGILTVVAYVGHAGGLREATLVEEFLNAQESARWLIRDEAMGTRPRLLAVRKNDR